MAAIFDATSYFTRRQADLRYVRAPLTATQVQSLFTDGTGVGTFPGSVIAPQTIPALAIADGALGLEQLAGNVRPPKIIASTSPQPTLPDPQFPAGSSIMWMANGGQLWITKDGNTWTPAVQSLDLTSSIAADAFASSIKPIRPVASLPTLTIDHGTNQPTDPSYKFGDILMLTGTGAMYQLKDLGSFNYVWDPVVKATNIDTTSGKITATQLDVNTVQAAVLTTAYLKAAVVSAGILTVDQMGVGSATIDTASVQKLEAAFANFTTINGDTANINWITAGMLAAGCVTTDKLIVGNFDNLMEDGGFENPAGSGCWAADGGGLHVASGYAHSGTQSAWNSTPGAGATAARNRMYFDIREGEKFFLEAWARAFSGADGTAQVRLFYFRSRADLTVLGTTDLVFLASECASGWTLKSIEGTAPTGCRLGRIEIWAVSQNAGIWSVDDVFCRRMVVSAYIDSLEALQIDAGQITTGILDCQNLTVKNLTADMFQGNILDCASLTVKNLHVTSINGVVVDGATVSGPVANATAATTSTTAATAGTATYASVLTGTLNASQVTAGTMYADRISGGTLNFASITVTNLAVTNSMISGTIVADKISGGTLNFASITVTNLAVTNSMISGSIVADKISGGTLNFLYITVANLSVTNLSGWGGATLNVSSGVTFIGSIGGTSVGINAPGCHGGAVPLWVQGTIAADYYRTFDSGGSAVSGATGSTPAFTVSGGSSIKLNFVNGLYSGYSTVG